MIHSHDCSSSFPFQTRLATLLVAVCVLAATTRDATAQRTEPVRTKYEKTEYRIKMRDGVELFTAVYAPRDASAKKRYPILMLRTCYGVRPYGKDKYRGSVGPNGDLQEDGFIFVYQDVRGCYMSQGTFKNMTPHIAHKKTPQDVDESTDTYDTISWLLKNVKHHNGRVGLWGISYPGFYAAAGMIDAHPALKAVSPQAPIADWWYDDFHHRGAFFLPHAFNFVLRFGQPRPRPTTLPALSHDLGTKDGYHFFLDLGPLSNANAYMRDRVEMWDNLVAHPNYDSHWQSRNLLPHLKNVAPAVLIVGGWFDAEDLYGPLQIYRRIEAANPDVQNQLVMGPWHHGGWARSQGDHLGNIGFESKTSRYFQRQVETAFFRAHLRDGKQPQLAEATMFNTGVNRWRYFDQWPPAGVKQEKLFFSARQRLSKLPPSGTQPLFDEFISDPSNPVPFTEDTDIGMTRAYMTDDQRFAACRPDVLFYQTERLDKAVTLCGPLVADLWVSTSQSDADWIVKLIDVFPPDAKNGPFVRAGKQLSNYQMMVRSEVIRGRFRDDPSKPKPFVSNQPTHLRLPLQDVLHTFRPGHRIMIQVQSTWFPLVDRNPQKYVDSIFQAKEEDFVKAAHRVYRHVNHRSHIEFSVLPD